jgi:hypothetical protein
MTDEELHAIVNALAEVIVPQLTEYADQRGDWVMQECHAAVDELRGQVGDALRGLVEEVNVRIVEVVQEQEHATMMRTRYAEWVMGEAMQLGIGVSAYAKFMRGVGDVVGSVEKGKEGG